MDSLLVPESGTLVHLIEPRNFNLDGAVEYWRGLGLAPRIVRGDKMHTAEDVYGETAAAFQFPLYFGYNMAALNELLTDLDWIPTDVGWVLVILRPDELFARDDDRQQSLWALAQKLGAVRRYWAEENEVRRAFNVLLVGARDATRVFGEWTAAGSEVVVNNQPGREHYPM